MAKLKIALYWAASCGGCEIATLAIHEKILKLAEVADIVFWPVGLDFKYADVVQIGTDNEVMMREMKNFGIDFYKQHRVYKKEL